MSVSPKRFFNGLLRRGSIRSREEQRWCRVDDFPIGSYNYRFLRTRAKGDFLRNPDYLWSPNPYWDSRAGLNAHVRQIAEELGGLVTSDATVVLSQQDFEATRRSRLECWEQAAHVELKECFEHLLDSQGYQLAMPGRSFRLEVLRDGDLVKLGLRPGEFATALLDNRYLGPQDDSVPLVEVFVAAGGGQFSSAGTFYSDQLAFTIGAHRLIYLR